MRAITNGAIVAGISPSRTSVSPNFAWSAAIANVAARNQTDAAAEGRAINLCDSRAGQFVELAKHRRQPLRIGPIPGLARIGHRPHPAQVGACRKRLARTGQHQHPRRRGGQVVERLRQLRD